MIEHVMVVPTDCFLKCGNFQGFSTEVNRYIPELFWSAAFKPRPEMEVNVCYKQLIPYCVLICGKWVFNYSRAKTQGEARLHGKRSIGVGGHISSTDGSQSGTSYEEGMKRELMEEIKLDSQQYRKRCIGILNDDSNDVGKVHLGIVHIISLNEMDILKPESSMMDPCWTPVDDLRAQIEQFENWSQILLREGTIEEDRTL